MKRSVITSGGGARIVWVQGLLASAEVTQRVRDAELYAGVSAGAIFSLLCARYVDDPRGLEYVRDLDFKLMPHWGGVSGILMTSLFQPYVFSHEQLCDALYRQLDLAPGEDAPITRDLSVGFCDIDNNQYSEKTFLAGSMIREEKIVDYVAASSSIYGLFQGWTHGDALYQDGGYAHNIPIDALRGASSDSIIFSLIPLDVTLPGSYGGNGFWKFLMAANITFYNIMYSDIGRGRMNPIEKTKHCIVYDTPHGTLYGSIHKERFDFVITYDKRLLNDLKRDGELAAMECFAGDLTVPMLRPSSPSSKWKWWVLLGVAALVIVVILVAL